MYVLICNAGSTSLKFKLYDMPSESVLARGHIERVGSRDDAVFKYYAGGYSLELGGQDVPDYETGIRSFLTCLTRGEGAVISDAGEIARVGYKATLSKGHYGVHELTDEVLDGMAEWISLAPLHPWGPSRRPSTGLSPSSGGYSACPTSGMRSTA